MQPIPCYRLPAEWEPQSGVFITWPHERSAWRPWLAEVELIYVRIALHISVHERLLINCWDASHIRHVHDLLEAAGAVMAQILLASVPFDDTWTRDYGPITVMEGKKPRLLDFTFNGWGGKFDANLDNAVTAHLFRAGVFTPAELTRVPLVLEGGSIDTDGAGTLLTTERCLLSPARNPDLNRRQIEIVLRRELGAERILWLAHGHLAGDDTDSHIDTLVRFCDIHTIAYVACDDNRDEHYEDLKRMEEELTRFQDIEGRGYRLIPLPWPRAKYDSEGLRLPASYANFLVINGAVLMPTYDDPADDEALMCLTSCFPMRQVIGIPCLSLIRQYGSLHCITMQLPEGVLCTDNPHSYT